MRKKILIPVISILIMVLYATLLVVQAAPPSGAIFTTTPDGGIVNENVHYDLKREVYLDGGPPPNAPQTAAGLDTGFYVFQVTDPSGHYLLSQDPARCRVVWVDDGVIQELVPPTSVPGLGADSDNWADKGPDKDQVCHIQDPPDPFDPAGPDDYGPSGRHDTNTDKDHGPPAIVVQLMPFGTTPNPGGVYKAWIIPLDSYTATGDLDKVPLAIQGKKAQPCPDFCAAADPGFGPPRSDSKTDNFKVKEFFPPEVTVRKFHDLNCNSDWDEGEPEIGVDQFVLQDGTIDPAGGGWPYTWTYPLNGGTNTELFFTPKTHLAPIPGIYSAMEIILPGWGHCVSFLDGTKVNLDNPVDVNVEGLSYETHEIVFGDCQLASVSGKKVIDMNGNGEITGDVCDPADIVNYPGCAGVAVNLDGMDNLGNIVHLTTVTGADGTYKFSDLFAGSYTITIEEPSGFFCSYPEFGNCSYDVDLLCSEEQGSFDFGDFSKAEVYGRKVIDIRADGPSADDTCPLDPDPWGNNDGCQGVTVFLDGWANLGWEVHEVTTTDADGYFEFLELFPGDYTISVNEPEGFFCSYPDPCNFVLNLTSDEVVDDLVFGDFSKAEVRGRKVIDIYADGPSADDTCPLDPDPWGNNNGCQGVLIDLDGHTYKGVHVHLQTYTDSDGYFEFLDLFPGDYTIALEEPAGFFCSYPDPCYYPLSLMSDQIADGLLFGDYSKAEIHVFKFFDLNENGMPDDGEAPLPGIEFCLYDGASQLISCQFTGTDGMAHWYDLMPGTYTVEESLPTGWFATTSTTWIGMLMSDEIAELDFGNVTNCVGLTPGYWVNWDNHYTADQFLILLQGTIAEGDIDLAEFYLTSVGCDDGDALHCMRRFLLANQLTLNLTKHPELPNPSDGSLFFACQLPDQTGTLGEWLAEALAIHTAGGEGYTRDWILWVKNILDWFANLNLVFYP